MEQDQLRLSDLFGLGGAAAVVGSTWAPWYRFSLSDKLLHRFDGITTQFGAGAQAFGGLLREFAQLAHDAGPINIDAWTALHDAATVLVVAAAVGAAALVAGHRIPRGVAAIAGLVALAFSVYHLVSRPLPSEVLGLGYGGYLACAGAATMIVSGLLQPRLPRPTTQSAAPPPPAWMTSSDAPVRRWAGS